MVTSAPENLDKRKAIRKTWGSWPQVRVVYLIGIPTEESDELRNGVDDEVSAFGDVLQIDLVDTYRNLTLKTCALVMWAFQNSWPERQVVIKVDDDTCVHMPLLTSVLDEFTDGIYGEYRNSGEPIRPEDIAFERWGLSEQEYAPSTFPPHVQGAFYVIAESSLGELHANLFVPKFLFLEDVYLTGLVARAANVSVQPMPSGTEVNPMDPDSNWRRQKTLLAQHQCTEKFQYRFWWYKRRKTIKRFLRHPRVPNVKSRRRVQYRNIDRNK